ncbi:MAG: ferrous iron transport protein B [Chloroflexi bacterium]|nr:ferrous iron transport protein B [Chloroflexota bacterium]
MRLHSAATADFAIDYGRDVEKEIEKLETVIVRFPNIQRHYPNRWLAVKLLERDADIQQKLMAMEGGAALLTKTQLSLARLEQSLDEDIDVVIADRRYSWIHEVVREALVKTEGDRLTRTDKIDRIVTHRFWGVVIFMVLMWAVFKLTADVSAPYLDWVDGVIGGPITNWVSALIGAIGLGGSWVESLFVNGIIAGVGGVLVFVPVLMSLYFALAVLEDSGYMARAAFVMDGLMNKIGLQGKSFLPMMVGFGCTVPAIYATRTLENEKDRILTGLLVPFMSCGARLPVYVLFAAIFFPKLAGAVVFGLYLLGIVTAVLLGLVLKNTLFKGKEQTALIMEMPDYRLPSWRGIWSHVWERTGSFIEGAWTVILITSIVLWFLMAIPARADSGGFAKTDVNDSVFATVSKAISPVMAPLGFDSWEASASLITGFVAKEVVVSTMSQTYGIDEAEGEAEPTTFRQDLIEIGTSFAGATAATIKSIPLIVGINLFAEEEDDQSKLMTAVRDGFETTSGGHGALAAMAFMVFVLIYTPCMVAVAAERQELGAKWMWFSVIGQLILAWFMALIVFQIGLLLGF